MQLNMLEAMNIYVNVVEQGSFIRAAEVLELHFVHIRPDYCYFISNSVLKIGWFFVTIKRLKIFFRLINYHSRLKGWLKICSKEITS